MDYELHTQRIIVESKEKWSDCIHKIPSLKFDSEWEIKIIPPFGGAISRFTVNKDGKQICSVYLDFYDRLGYFGEPYYELYPFADDIKRYSLDETDELLRDIRAIWNNN